MKTCNGSAAFSASKHALRGEDEHTSNAVLLYRAFSWLITTQNWQTLRAFHNKALRHMTRRHITKNQGGRGEYLCHVNLEWKCSLFDIKTYMEKRRGTLRKYLEEFQSKLLKEAFHTKTPCRNANKILWWNQKCIAKDEITEKTSFWKKKRKLGST